MPPPKAVAAVAVLVLVIGLCVWQWKWVSARLGLAKDTGEKKSDGKKTSAAAQSGGRTLPGYKFTAGMNSSGSTLKNLRSLEGAMFDCDRTPECAGFNSEGHTFVKGDLKKVDAWTRPFQGVYMRTKDPPSKKVKSYYGFDFYPHLDVDGGNIGSARTSTDKAAEDCIKDANCRGFNTAGYLKSAFATKTDPNFSAEDEGVYLRRRNFGAFEEPGFIFLKGQDVKDSNIKQLTDRRSALSLCASKPDCKAVNTDGWLKNKNTLADQTSWKGTNRGIYVKIPSGQKYKGYTFLKGQDGSGNIKQIKDVGAAIKECSKTTECTGINTEGWLKSSSVVVNKSAWKSTNHGIYQKNLPEQSRRAFTFVREHDVKGSNIKQVKKIADALEACASNPLCDGVNTDGWLKKSDKLQTRWKGTNKGIYMKDPNQLFPDFDFYRGVDIANGGTSSHVADNLKEAARVCLKDPKCLAFNTEGYFRTTSGGVVPSTKFSGYNQGLYIRRQGR